MQLLILSPADGSDDPLIIVFSPGGKVLRQSTLDALANVQNAIDGIPANNGGGGTDGGTGVTSDDLDNLDAALNGQADAIRAKSGQQPPTPAQPQG